MPSPYNWSAADNAFLVKAIKSKGSVAGALAVICERLGRDFAHSTIYQRYHRILRGELPT